MCLFLSDWIPFAYKQDNIDIDLSYIMRKVLRIQNYLNRKTSPLPIIFSEPFKLKNSNKIIIPFTDKLFFQTPVLRLENLLELSNGVYCAEFKINESLKHLMLRRFLMNLDMAVISKLYQSSQELFKSSSGRSVQFSKDVIRDKYYPALRYEDSNNSFYLQLIINENAFDSLEEQMYYYLFVELQNIHFHKKLFLCNLKLDSFQKISDESEDEDEDESDAEAEVEVEESTEIEDEEKSDLEKPGSTATEIDQEQSFIHPTNTQDPDIHDSQKLQFDQENDMMSQFLEMQENIKTKMKELDTMTHQIKHIYSKMKST